MMTKKRLKAVTDPHLHIRGGSHPDPEWHKGGSQKNFLFGPSGLSLV